MFFFFAVNGKKVMCGGVLISEQYVLTSALCGTSGINLTSVILGEFDTSTPNDCLPQGNQMTCKNAPVRMDVDRVILHEDYNNDIAWLDTHETGDIALVKLKEKVTFSPDIQSICLPENQPKGQSYSVAGWSRFPQSTTNGPNRIEMSNVTEVDRTTCSGRHGNWFVTEEYICAGDTRNSTERVCVADAGGPLMGYETKSDGSIRPTVFGVTNINFDCSGHGKWERVFTQVHKYTPWILKHL